jgi:hypothetical protein
MARRETIQKRWSTDQLITGIELQDWVKMLSRNGWRVSPEYFHRAAWVGAWSLPATLFGRLEDAQYSRQLASYEVNPTPIFILGHWRSGTTHLHNMLGRDPAHTFSTVYQCVFPSAFLTTGGFLPKLTGGLLTETRTYDNVKFGWEESAEDEIALAKLCGLSPYVAFMFPENAAKYEKYIDFLEATEAEREEWKRTFMYLLKKIMIGTGGRRVVVKSCTHSARIPMLLEMFPDAKFIHIHRNPYECFASTLHMRSHTDWENFFHLPDESVEGQRMEQTAILGQRIFERLIEDQRLIPRENYYEVAYEDLIGNEARVLEEIYRKFELPSWGAFEPILTDYLAGLKGYQRNRLKIDERFQALVWERWRAVFDHYGYPQEYNA